MLHTNQKREKEQEHMASWQEQKAKQARQFLKEEDLKEEQD